MWFKQIQLFQLNSSSYPKGEDLERKMDAFRFRPCLPSMPNSAGWVTPVDDESNVSLVKLSNHYQIFCLQIEEKILPMQVIRQALSETVKQIEASENRKLRHKEKFSLKDDIIMTLLPRAFSKLHRTYAYLNTQNNMLVLGTANSKITEQFISIFKKSISEDIKLVQTNNISSTLTSWLKNKNYSSSFSIEKSCLLQDPRQENRKIRCQQQDLFATSIQSLIQDGCEVIQLALSWQDRVSFVLSQDFSLRSIQYHDEITAQVKEMEAASILQQFAADFYIMSATLLNLFEDLLSQFNDTMSPNFIDIKTVNHSIAV